MSNIPAICTVFDRGVRPKPLYSMVNIGGVVKFLPLFLKGLNTKLSTVYSNLQFIEDVITKSDVYINDISSHLRYIHVAPQSTKRIYEFSQDGKTPSEDVKAIKKHLCLGLINAPKPKLWMAVKGGAALVYAHLEKRGVMYGHKLVHPIYDMKTVSGRSRSREFNILGVRKDDPITHPDPTLNYMICFDWVAADMRLAGLLSGDKFINNSFKKSDPYIHTMNAINTNEELISRSECKREYLRALYDIDTNGMFMNLTSGLKSWMMSKIKEYGSDVFKTICGRPQHSGEIKTDFNAIIQGSVAEAIQLVLKKVGEKSINNIFTEQHDSLIICCVEREIQMWIDFVKNLMLRPFETIGLSEVTMPVKIKIGTSWGHWIDHSVFR